MNFAYLKELALTGLCKITHGKVLFVSSYQRFKNNSLGSWHGY